MKNVKLLFSVLIFLSCLGLTGVIIKKSRENQQLKADYSEISHVAYGLFSMNAWKEKLGPVMQRQIGNITIDKDNEKHVQKILEGQLTALIDKFYQRMEKKNSKSAGGFFRQSFIESVVDIKEIKQDVPVYALAMVQELSKKENEERLQLMARKKTDKLLDETFESQDLRIVQAALKRHGQTDMETAKSVLSVRMASTHKEITIMTLAVIVLCMLLFGIHGFTKETISTRTYLLFTGSLLLLLLAGVTTPMIDIEAKISELSFVLMGEKIQFNDQMLFFQSKSILDVFLVMIRHEDLEMKLVGVLLVTFSIVFPIIKLFSSFLYFCDYRDLRENRWIKFFVLKSGKWSMADVMVVAIFMAFIGFNGIIGSQLEKLSGLAGSTQFLTTNGTSLQPGYYLFLAYSLLAMFLAGFLRRKEPEELS